MGARAPWIKPVSPPIEKRKMKARQKRSGGSRTMEPLCKVATQLKTLIALGIATKKVRREKRRSAKSLWPLTNM